MAQHDAVIDDADGLAFLADLNDFTAAIISNNSGSSAPSVTYPFQWWADTTTGYMKQRNSANSAWISLFRIADGNLAQLGGISMSGEINEKRSTAAATATTTPIWDAGTGNIIDATGTPTITDFPDAPQAGARRIVYFAAGTILTDNANIDVEGDANYTVAAGDRVEIEALTTTTFKAWIRKKSGAAVTGATTSIAQGNSSVAVTDAGTGKVETTLDGVIISEETLASRKSTIDGGSTLYPEFKCRAWVNFNGTGTVAIRASGNVSSITDNGTGNYTVNFITAFPDANYVAVGQGSNISTEGRFQFENAAARTVSAYRFATVDSGQASSDSTHASVAFFR